MDYTKLLKEYNKLQKENEVKKSKGIHDFNLINALLKKTDEVNLHSNFIYSMINPNSSHYMGNKFLELFLKAINEDGFIDLSNARVHKEKGKIDLLIEDGEKVIIIENKLKAKDQRYQISRYIQYSIKNYLGDSKKDIESKLRIVYLSEYKAKPSKKSESIIGFSLDGKILKWEGSAIEKKTLKLDLLKRTAISFNRVQHSKELLRWVEESIKFLKTKSTSCSSLIYAFEEYKTILIRLDNKRKKDWKKIMSLDEYTIELSDEEEQKEMYAFMCEANSKLNIYISNKLYESIEDYISHSSILKIASTTFKAPTSENILNWMNQKGSKDSYRDIGFQIDDYFFALGKNNIAVGKIEEGWNSAIFTSRENLQNNKEKNLFELIAKIKKTFK